MGTLTAISTPDTPDKPWRALHVFNLYRLVIAGVIAVIFHAGEGSNTFGQTLPDLFGYAIIIWLCIIFLSGFFSRLRKPSFQLQTYGLIIADIAFITLLMYASGGIASGFGVLLLVIIAASGILSSRHIPFAFAAIATLAIFFIQGIQGYQMLVGGESLSFEYAQNGLLGAALFAVALLSHLLAQRIRTSEALAEQRREELTDLTTINELALQQLETGVVVVDSRNAIQLCNSAARNMLGHGSGVVSRSLDIFAPKLYECLMQWRQGRQNTPEPFRNVTDGKELLPHFKSLKGKSNLATLIFLDDTSLLSHRAQQSKLASLGQLTASIAHEIRNPLSAITHAGQLLSEANKLEESDYRLIEIIQNQSERLDTIVKSILALSRKEEFTPERLELTSWINQFITGIINERDITSGSIHIEHPESPLYVYVDPLHLDQIMYNVSENGIRHSRIKNPDILLKIVCSTDNETVRIDVIDYGDGVPEEHREKLFEPFFTTLSRGTGLGLYIARELSQINHTHLQYIDDPACGARFRISFNRIQE